MKPVNQMELQIPSLSHNEAFARATLAAFVAQLDPTVGDLNDVKTAVSEAVTNCIVHAYRDCIGIIYISAKLFENRAVIKIRDKGCGIPDVKQAMEPLFTTGGEERAGLGFAVMQSFCDRVRVHSVVGKGTSVILTKNFRRREKVSTT